MRLGKGLTPFRIASDKEPSVTDEIYEAISELADIASHARALSASLKESELHEDHAKYAKTIYLLAALVRAKIERRIGSDGSR
jgi:hypothetical protein